MRNVLLLTLILLPFSVSALVCDHSNTHLSSNNCMRAGCAPGDTLCEQCCDEICTRCHAPTSEETNLSDPTEWNPSGTQMVESFPAATEETTFDLADTCVNCHSGDPEENRFAEGHNHPVDVSYDSGKQHTDLHPDPNGPLLVCAEGSTDCMVRCITCHKLHHDTEESPEEGALLRMSNDKSALCIACHNK